VAVVCGSAFPSKKLDLEFVGKKHLGCKMKNEWNVPVRTKPPAHGSLCNFDDRESRASGLCSEESVPDARAIFLFKRVPLK
jgi:hypothetical protein